MKPHSNYITNYVHDFPLDPRWSDFYAVVSRIEPSHTVINCLERIAGQGDTHVADLCEIIGVWSSVLNCEAHELDPNDWLLLSLRYAQISQMLTMPSDSSCIPQIFYASLLTRFAESYMEHLTNSLCDSEETLPAARQMIHAGVERYASHSPQFIEMARKSLSEMAHFFQAVNVERKQTELTVPPLLRPFAEPIDRRSIAPPPPPAPPSPPEAYLTQVQFASWHEQGDYFNYASPTVEGYSVIRGQFTVLCSRRIAELILELSVHDNDLSYEKAQASAYTHLLAEPRIIHQLLLYDRARPYMYSSELRISKDICTLCIACHVISSFLQQADLLRKEWDPNSAEIHGGKEWLKNWDFEMDYPSQEHLESTQKFIEGTLTSVRKLIDDLGLKGV